MAKRQVPWDCMTRSLPGTGHDLPLMWNSRSGRADTLAQSMVYCPRRLGTAPTEVAIFIICMLGPVMRDVPESTMPLVFPAENEPTLTSSISISQYLASVRGVHVISPVNLVWSEEEGRRER